MQGSSPRFGTGLSFFLGHLTTSPAVFVPCPGCYSKGKQVASNGMSIHFPQRRCLEFDSKKGRSRVYDVCIKWEFIIGKEFLDSSVKDFQHKVHRSPTVKNSYVCSSTEIPNLNKALWAYILQYVLWIYIVILKHGFYRMAISKDGKCPSATQCYPFCFTTKHQILHDFGHIWESV